MGVSCKRDNGTAVVTLDWPERRNALGPAEAAELTAQFAEVADDPKVTAVVLTGNGAFCAGGDLHAIRELAAQGPVAVRDAVYDVFQKLVLTMVALPVPLIAAVDGAAVGLGLDLALACDRRLMGPRGWLAQGWGQVGLIAGTGGVHLLNRLSPVALWEMLGSADRVTCARAEQLGLATAAPDTALAAASADAERLALIPRPALLGYVELSRAALRKSLEAHLQECLRLQVELITAPDFLDRTARFAERR
jgi:2-(1,2-epoxy-1,2-dihydrophenyl)acetyl-CoA isomerase